MAVPATNAAPHNSAAARNIDFFVIFIG